MNDLDILSLAYQRRDAGDPGTLDEIIAQIRADLAAMQPAPPGPGDVIGVKSEVVNGVRKNYNIMGDGSQVEVVS